MLANAKLRRLGLLYRHVKSARLRFERWRYDSRLLTNVNRVEKPSEKRALLVYLTRPFLIDRRSTEFVTHQNMWACVELARLLDELDYVVDVLNWDNYAVPVNGEYDLLLGLGRADQLAMQLPDRTLKLHLATGSAPGFTAQRERERVDEIKRRRGCDLEAVRRPSDNSEYLKCYDAIACIGNEVTVDTYRPHFSGRTYSWNNHGYDRFAGIPEDKDFEDSRRSFLYFAGGGQVLIGLDLLLEAFAVRPNLRLFLCGPFEQELDFVKCFRKEIYETRNIVPVGWVTVGSTQYFELTRKCGMSLFPICAGGSPGSVVACMGQGLIPIVSKEAGIDTGDFGITLKTRTVEEIGRVVDWISGQTSTWHEETTNKVLRAARRDFSQAAFTRRFLEILKSEIARSNLA
jgi:hypothetical protein